MHTQSYAACINIQNVPLLNLSMEDSITAIEMALDQNIPTRISFVNADCINIAAHDVSYFETLKQSEWVFIDGIGMRIAGKILQHPVRDNVNGTDLFPLLCASLEANGKRLFLLGAKPGIVDDVASWISEHYPNLQLAGTHHGYFRPEDEAAVIEQLKNSKADVLLTAMGVPLQEKWLAKHMAETGVTVAMGVGGLFDFYSGRIPRAPMWMRRIGLEWFFRFMQEPGRLWRRYFIGNSIFLCRITLEWLVVQLRKKKEHRNGGIV